MNLSGLLLSLLGLAGACAAPAHSVTNDDDLLGGIDARSAALDAVGAIVIDDGDDTMVVCTGTLIASDAVLTGRGCGAADMGEGTTYFVVGSDVWKSRRRIAIDRSTPCSSGCNVAVHHLSEPILDIPPLAVVPGPLPAATIGKPFNSIGFGRRPNPLGERKRFMGAATLRAIDGKPLRLSFPTEESFYAAAVTQFGDLAAVDRGTITRAYERPLMDGEVFAGGITLDSQICEADRGGPLIGTSAGKLAVFGVASSPAMELQGTCATFGATYEEITPEVQALLHPNDPCDGIADEAGHCEGEIAVRCTRSYEGPRRVTRTDCALTFQRCVSPSSGNDLSCGD